MKPYYQDKWVTIYHGDCREILPLLDIDSNVVLVTDPPYGISFNGDWLTAMHVANGSVGNTCDDVLIGDDGSLDLRFLFAFDRRIIFGHPYIYDDKATGWLIWDKQPGLDAHRTMTSPVEIASTTLWQGFRILRCMWAGYLRDNGESRFQHPTQKPQKVMGYLISQCEPSFRAMMFCRYMEREFERGGVTRKEIAELFPSRTGRLTGCVSNWLLGYNIPTEEEYQRIAEYLQAKTGSNVMGLPYQQIDRTKECGAQPLILDPFLGSGTTCFCAKKLLRHSIGIEIEEKYCEIAARRCSQEVMELV